MTKQDVILNFIKQFTGPFDTTATSYWFAEILKSRFWPHENDVHIQYHPVMNRFACRIDGTIYDHSGVQKAAGWRNWQIYRIECPARAKALIEETFALPSGALVCLMCTESYDDDYGNLICSRDNHPCCGDDICCFTKENSNED